ncbi:GGDEF domain-containing protein [Pseudomonas alkylphenolica]|uniref:diguanylate cyclase n=1 Tax=Pseudomonas alkylphenolica TaxID=237609 RepID=A0A077F7X5_9PSED|nr:GGDEF domain-containing protein [Pseudomonas alkylphenolica]AIL61538.1 diguanylate cyclase (GGDEF) domain-containing protein [Pseudomonas alkylphenolica]QGW77398.1 diguanylate cyclase [Pseudomonas alkylphenolica]
MYKTIEQQVRRNIAPPELRREFRQHDFESLHSFCLLIFGISIGIWLLFDLIVSYLGQQDFTWKSMAFITVMATLSIILAFTRKAGHFDLLNLVFIGVITLAMRLVIEGLPQELRPAWLMLGASSVLYSVSVLPVRRWSFFAALVITWINLHPFQVPGLHLLDLRGVMFICYAVFINGLILYTYLKMRRAKLYNFYMSKVLLDQAYVDALTEIPNRRSFMAKAQTHLQEDDEQSRYLAMVDIDNFKKVNDQFGHDIGDVVLKRTAANIKASMTEFEYARLGGEEFAIYLWGINQADAEQRVDALCQRVREDAAEHPVTISIGLTRIRREDNLSNALVKADEALYQAKHGGKDRYVLWREATNPLLSPAADES